MIGIIPLKLPVVNVDKEMYRAKDYVAPAGTEPGVRYSTKHPYCVRNHAQLLVNYHCHLSNVHNFKYLAFHDFDEILVPRRHHTLKQLLQYLEKDKQFQRAASVVFQEAFYCYNKTELPSLHLKLVTDDGIYINTSKSVKSIVKPAQTRVMEVHTVSHAIKGYIRKYVLPSYLGTKNHYRLPNNCKNTNNSIGGLNTYLHPYLQKLRHSVAFVMKQLA